MTPTAAARLAAGLLLGLILVPARTDAWVLRSAGSDGVGVAGSPVLAPDGNLVVAGGLGEVAPLDFEATVTKHAASDGTVIWRYTNGGNGSDTSVAVRIDTAGDVIALLSMFRAADVYDTAIVKLSGADGTEIWRRDFAGPDYQIGVTIVLTSGGDPIITMSSGTTVSFIAEVIRFDGATGVTLWTHPFLDPGVDARATSLAVDAADDVLVGGDVDAGGIYDVFRIAKLDGVSGAEVWRSGLPVSDGGTAYAIAADGMGDVVASGQNSRFENPPSISTNDVPVVAKFDGGTGASLWVYEDLGGDLSGFDGWATALAIEAGGDVYASGYQEGAMLALRVDGATGSMTWRRDLTAPVGGLHTEGGVGETVRVGANGVPVFGGDLGNSFAATGLDPSTGETLWVQSLPGDNHNAGRVFGLVLDPAGYVFAAGYSVFPLIPDQGNQTNEYTVVRWVDPVSPPPVVGNCTPAPRPDCRAAPPRKSSLKMKDVASVKSDLIKWKWTAADPTTTGNFGDPLAEGNDFDFCIYDGTSSQIFGAVIAGDGGCDKGAPCWRALGTVGFRYRAKTREVDGVNDLMLRSGAPGKGRVTLKRKGRPLGDTPMPVLSPLTLSLTVQLQRDGGTCFGATFSIAGTSDATRFSAKSD